MDLEGAGNKTGWLVGVIEWMIVGVMDRVTGRVIGGMISEEEALQY